MRKQVQKTLKVGRFGMRGKGGFTLTELMVVVAIVAILAVVATPAYINYINRTKQGQAVNLLLSAQAEMEEYLADNGTTYASKIQCLPSFIPSGAAGQACLASCAGCAQHQPAPGTKLFLFRRAGHDRALLPDIGTKKYGINC